MGNTFSGTGGFEGTSVSQTAGSFESALANGGFDNNGNDGTLPFAYLNFILFNDAFEMVDAGWQPVPEEAEFDPGEEGLPDMHRKVEFEEPLTVSEAGYIYIWVSSESENTKVWPACRSFSAGRFDDLKITHTQTLVTQATDYGVWGDVIREQKTDESVYRYGYQGQFAEKDEETGWNHFELREYDPTVARWTAVDPKRMGFSPYIGMGNNPVSGTDPDGGSPTDIIEMYNGQEVSRIVNDDPFDIVIQTWDNKITGSFTTIGIYDKIWFSGFQLSPSEWMRQYREYKPLATGAIDFDAGSQLMVGEIAAMGFKGIGAGISALRGLTQKTVTEGSYLVYEGIGKEGVRYIGITSRDIAERTMEHMADPLKAGLRFVPIKGLENLSKQAARVAEQRLINYYGLQKNGGILLNRINSIAPSKWSLNSIK